MTLTVHKIDGRWFFDQDVAKPVPPCVTHVILVPDDCEFIDLFDASRQDLKLHALRFHVREARKLLKDAGHAFPSNPLDFNADYLTEIAESGLWKEIATIVTTIV